ncbi:14766_t:CDS:2, partial [Racocetra persica]
FSQDGVRGRSSKFLMQKRKPNKKPALQAIQHGNETGIEPYQRFGNLEST